ncbi:MAG TPA: cytochrome c oxidase subunit 2A [Candidatus Methylomirabilis sp.]|nr:cytochrome c oxidase subunit 2A [Candidatus Methylomirabilis sp.]
MDENEHPKGALVFILIFLLLLVAFWLNTYMQLWLRY